MLLTLNYEQISEVIAPTLKGLEMEDELSMRRYEVAALRKFYQEVMPAIKTLSPTLKLMALKPTNTKREQSAWEVLLRERE